VCTRDDLDTGQARPALGRPASQAEAGTLREAVIRRNQERRGAQPALLSSMMIDEHEDEDTAQPTRTIHTQVRRSIHHYFVATARRRRPTEAAAMDVARAEVRAAVCTPPSQPSMPPCISIRTGCGIWRGTRIQDSSERMSTGGEAISLTTP
jgi:hypothetical protein